MQELANMEAALARIETRLGAIDQKLDSLAMARRKSMEWIAQLSEHINSLDSFREEVRSSLEPLFTKIEMVEDNLRILRHATSDVSRRVDAIDAAPSGQSMTAG
jgi:chromosome segregation ATPase